MISCTPEPSGDSLSIPECGLFSLVLPTEWKALPPCFFHLNSTHPLELYSKPTSYISRTSSLYFMNTQNPVYTHHMSRSWIPGIPCSWHLHIHIFILPVYCVCLKNCFLSVCLISFLKWLSFLGQMICPTAFIYLPIPTFIQNIVSIQKPMTSFFLCEYILCKMRTGYWKGRLLSRVDEMLVQFVLHDVPVLSNPARMLGITSRFSHSSQSDNSFQPL